MVGRSATKDAQREIPLKRILFPGLELTIKASQPPIWKVKIIALPIAVMARTYCLALCYLVSAFFLNSRAFGQAPAPSQAIAQLPVLLPQGLGEFGILAMLRLHRSLKWCSTRSSLQRALKRALGMLGQYMKIIQYLRCPVCEACAVERPCFLRDAAYDP